MSSECHSRYLRRRKSYKVLSNANNSRCYTDNGACKVGHAVHCGIRERFAGDLE